uniref:SH3 domain-containing protein n=1 Tax=Desertifilum tharense IPPAS B-1220 TaxID=1781255 RepID=A0ACD5GQH0_9CYAN
MADGLILREASGTDANRVGGVGYNERVIVLQESGDKAWQKIRLNGSEQEGWVKAGNLERIN